MILLSEFVLNTGRYIEEAVGVTSSEYWVNISVTNCGGPLLTRLTVGLKPNQAREVAAALLSAAESVDACQKK